jgi:hypothetical protein
MPALSTFEVAEAAKPEQPELEELFFLVESAEALVVG